MKCCGTCRSWIMDEDRPTRGECGWQFHHPVPLAMAYQQSYMHYYEGVYCPCWETREDETGADAKSGGSGKSQHDLQSTERGPESPDS